MKISRKRLKEIVKEEMIAEAYYGSIPGEPETPAEYGGALDAAKIQRHLSDKIDDGVRLDKLDINDLSIETVRANHEIPWDKFQAIDDEVLGDIIRDYQRKQKFYSEAITLDIEVGDIVIFHSLLLHRTVPNEGELLRFAVPQPVRSIWATETGFEDLTNWEILHRSSMSRIRMMLGNPYLSPFRTLGSERTEIFSELS